MRVAAASPACPWLQEVRALVTADSVPAKAYDEALQTVRRASCNCYAFEALSADSVETRVCA